MTRLLKSASHKVRFPNCVTRNVKFNSVAVLLGYNQVFLQPEVLNFLPIYFPHILSISRKLYLFSWERLDSSDFVCTSPRTEKQGESKHMFMPFEIVSICV